MWTGENTSMSKGLGPGGMFRSTLAPLLLILSTPVTSIVLSRTVTASAHDGGFLANGLDIVEEMWAEGVVRTVTRDAFDPAAWRVIGVYMVVQLALMRFMPGPLFDGPMSVKGNVPVYRDNCFACYVASFALFFGGVYGGLFNGGVAFDLFPQLISS